MIAVAAKDARVEELLLKKHEIQKINDDDKNNVIDVDLELSPPPQAMCKIKFSTAAPLAHPATTEVHRSDTIAAMIRTGEAIRLIVSPGRLGLTLAMIPQSEGGGGARITKVDVACTFRNQVAVGQIVACIDGKLVMKLDDLYVGKERVREFIIVRRPRRPRNVVLQTKEGRYEDGANQINKKKRKAGDGDINSKMNKECKVREMQSSMPPTNITASFPIFVRHTTFATSKELNLSQQLQEASDTDFVKLMTLELDRRGYSASIVRKKAPVILGNPKSSGGNEIENSIRRRKGAPQVAPPVIFGSKPLAFDDDDDPQIALLKSYRKMVQKESLTADDNTALDTIAYTILEHRKSSEDDNVIRINPRLFYRTTLKSYLQFHGTRQLSGGCQIASTRKYVATVSSNVKKYLALITPKGSDTAVEGSNCSLWECIVKKLAQDIGCTKDYDNDFTLDIADIVAIQRVIGCTSNAMQRLKIKTESLLPMGYPKFFPNCLRQKLAIFDKEIADHHEKVRPYILQYLLDDQVTRLDPEGGTVDVSDSTLSRRRVFCAKRIWLESRNEDERYMDFIQSTYYQTFQTSIDTDATISYSLFKLIVNKDGAFVTDLHDSDSNAMKTNVQKKKKKKKKVKDPNAPKRPMNAYFLYQNASMERIRGQNPGTNVAAISTIVNTEFHAMTEEERAYWDELAKKEKERYVREKESYDNDLAEQAKKVESDNNPTDKLDSVEQSVIPLNKARRIKYHLTN